MRTIFVTATGTEIGKTYITAALARYLCETGKNVQVLKPVLTGFDPDDFSASDPAILLDALGVAAAPEAISRVSPFRYRAPLAPNLAAAQEGKTLDFEAVVKACEDAMHANGDHLLIEGIGGIMVPLDDRHTVVDLVAALACPVLLVAGSYLGTISHTLTAVEVARARGLVINAIVVNETENSSVSLDATAATAQQFTSLPTIAVPRSGAASPAIRRLAGFL